MIKLLLKPPPALLPLAKVGKVASINKGGGKMCWVTGQVKPLVCVAALSRGSLIVPDWSGHSLGDIYRQWCYKIGILETLGCLVVLDCIIVQVLLCLWPAFLICSHCDASHWLVPILKLFRSASLVLWRGKGWVIWETKGHYTACS